MSWDDYVFEDPWESYERCMEDDSYSESYFGAEYSATFRRALHKRECTKCGIEFSCKFPQKCPDCGGWTKEST